MSCCFGEIDIIICAFFFLFLHREQNEEDSGKMVADPLSKYAHTGCLCYYYKHCLLPARNMYMVKINLM